MRTVSVRSLFIISLLCLLNALFISGCKKRSWNKLSPKQTREVMMDLAITRSLIQSRGYELPDSTRQAIYDDLFARHGVTQRDYDSTLVWYTRYKIKSQVVYTQMVRDSLKQIEQLLAEREAEKTKSDNAIEQYDKDSVNFLKNVLLWFAPEHEQINHFAQLELTTSPESDTEFRLTTRIHGLSLKNKTDLKLNLIMDLDDSTSLSKEILIPRNGLFELSQTVPQDRKALRIKAFLRSNAYISGLDSVNRKIPGSAHRIVVDSFAVVRYTPAVKEKKTTEEGKEKFEKEAINDRGIEEKEKIADETSLE
ncbi:hypothetical protein HR11_08240 [Porphyromonas macacae]|uniref:DUF4296 domain-containing protein n=1 Tax=Porphyromonas macacae TaxID=28115 RepID=A0A0A2G7V2_9PORP|nr:DUF4296 domain-containing protein [Porphyromonas macacae]KGN74759.1 hypothetical protein HQ47_04285 [Porphyromonas macacae]KGN98517.1 hypothetical protein HR11_08240 [Porphyromonas macacae]SUB88298.1 Uncharacterised protein [Porphyromonas macacae]